MGPELVRVRLVVHGEVQGVGYRAFACREALRYRVVGFTRNCDDGTVEIEAEGPWSAVEAFIGELHRGPRFSRVMRVETVARETITETGYAGFSVRY